MYTTIYTLTVDDGQLQLPKCGNDIANTVKFLDREVTNDRQGFIAICLPAKSHQAAGWALLCDDGDDQAAGWALLCDDGDDLCMQHVDNMDSLASLLICLPSMQFHFVED